MKTLSSKRERKAEKKLQRKEARQKVKAKALKEIETREESHDRARERAKDDSPDLGFEEISSEINEEVFNEPSATINVVQHEDEQEITSGRTFQKKNEQVMKEEKQETHKSKKDKKKKQILPIDVHFSGDESRVRYGFHFFGDDDGEFATRPHLTVNENLLDDSGFEPNSIKEGALSLTFKEDSIHRFFYHIVHMKGPMNLSEFDGCMKLLPSKYIEKINFTGGLERYLNFNPWLQVSRNVDGILVSVNESVQNKENLWKTRQRRSLLPRFQKKLDPNAKEFVPQKKAVSFEPQNCRNKELTDLLSFYKEPENLEIMYLEEKDDCAATSEKDKCIHCLHPSSSDKAKFELSSSNSEDEENITSPLNYSTPCIPAGHTEVYTEQRNGGQGSIVLPSSGNVSPKTLWSDHTGNTAHSEDSSSGSFVTANAGQSSEISGNDIHKESSHLLSEQSFVTSDSSDNYQKNARRILHAPTIRPLKSASIRLPSRGAKKGSTGGISAGTSVHQKSSTSDDSSVYDGSDEKSSSSDSSYKDHWLASHRHQTTATTAPDHHCSISQVSPILTRSQTEETEMCYTYNAKTFSGSRNSIHRRPSISLPLPEEDFWAQGLADGIQKIPEKHAQNNLNPDNSPNNISDQASNADLPPQEPVFQQLQAMESQIFNNFTEKPESDALSETQTISQPHYSTTCNFPLKSQQEDSHFLWSNPPTREDYYREGTVALENIFSSSSNSSSLDRAFSQTLFASGSMFEPVSHFEVSGLPGLVTECSPFPWSTEDNVLAGNSLSSSNPKRREWSPLSGSDSLEGVYDFSKTSQLAASTLFTNSKEDKTLVDTPGAMDSDSYKLPKLSINNAGSSLAFDFPRTPGHKIQRPHLVHEDNSDDFRSRTTETQTNITETELELIYANLEARPAENELQDILNQQAITEVFMNDWLEQLRIQQKVNDDLKCDIARLTRRLEMTETAAGKWKDDLDQLTKTYEDLKKLNDTKIKESQELMRQLESERNKVSNIQAQVEDLRKLNEGQNKLEAGNHVQDLDNTFTKVTESRKYGEYKEVISLFDPLIRERESSEGSQIASEGGSQHSFARGPHVFSNGGLESPSGHVYEANIPSGSGPEISIPLGSEPEITINKKFRGSQAAAEKWPQHHTTDIKQTVKNFTEEPSRTQRTDNEDSEEYLQMFYSNSTHNCLGHKFASFVTEAKGSYQKRSEILK